MPRAVPAAPRRPTPSEANLAAQVPPGATAYESVNGAGEGEPRHDFGAPPRPEDLGIGALFWAVRDAAIVGEAHTGRVVLWNPAAEALFGYRADEAVGMPLEALVPAPLRERHRAGLARFAATGRGPLLDGDRLLEVPAVRKGGETIAVELRLTALRPGHRGSPPRRYALALVRDATERTRLARERAALLAAAQEHARRLEEVAAL
jgi:PAS domain S-box-containing protein